MAATDRKTSAASEQAMAPAVRAEEKAVPDRRFARPECLFFGIGAQKCGTTWLHVYLSGHREVHVPRYGKELHYWSSAIRDRKIPPLLERQMPRRPFRYLLGAGARPILIFRQFRKLWFLRKWYKANIVDSPTHSVYCDLLFAGYRKEKVVGEITPAYALCKEETFAEMASLAPDVRFIFIMRDPVSRLWSGCRHSIRNELGQNFTTTDAVAERVLSSLAEPGNFAFHRSSYDRTIRSLENVVSPGNIAYFFYETLFQQSEIDRLCAFLGVESVPAVIDKKVHVRADAAETMPSDVARQAREALAPTYKFCRAKFGTVPPEWQDMTVMGEA